MSDALDRLAGPCDCYDEPTLAATDHPRTVTCERCKDIATVRFELKQLREERDAAQRYREGLREALAIIENSREFGLPLNVPVVDVVVERGRALLADSPDGGGAK